MARVNFFLEPNTGVKPISMLSITDIDLYDDVLAAMSGAERLNKMRVIMENMEYRCSEERLEDSHRHTTQSQRERGGDEKNKS